MRTGARTRGLRGRMILLVLGAVTFGVALLLAAFNLVLAHQLDSDLNGLLRARADAQLSTLDVTNGRLTVSEAPDQGTDPQVWVFAGGQALERPRRTEPSVDSAALELSGGPGGSIDVAKPSVRLLAVPVASAGEVLGTVVVAASKTPYEHTERTALISSIVLALVIVGAVGLIARWLLDAALHPVARMTADAAEWSERDLDRRFSLGPPSDELTTLAATLDALLDRLAAGMRREQRLSSEMSHELRTPLAKISTQAQLLAGAPDLAPEHRAEAEGIVRAADGMREVIEVLMSAARADSDGQAGIADVSAAVRAAVGAVGESGIFVEIAGGDLRVSAEQALVQRIMAPLLENAKRFALGQATVTIAHRGQWVEVVVEDDGPGVRAGEEAVIFEPGRRGDDTHDGAGLGLSLARRLARSAGGDVVADPAAPGGRFVVRLPPA